MAQLLGVPFEWIEIDSFTGETRTPEFLALNPAGQVPLAVLADGRALAQSNAIMLHLAEGSRLIPADGYDRAKMYEWLFWEQYSHEPAIAVRIARLYFLRTPEAALFYARRRPRSILPCSRKAMPRSLAWKCG